MLKIFGLIEYWHQISLFLNVFCLKQNIFLIFKNILLSYDIRAYIWNLFLLELKYIRINKILELKYMLVKSNLLFLINFIFIYEQ